MTKSSALPAVLASKEQTVATMRSVTLEQAIEQGRPLCDAMAEAKVATVDALHVMLAEVAKFHGADGFKEPQRMEVIKALADRYGYLSIEEIALVMSRARTPDGSRDSKVFGQLTPAVVLGWVGAYANSDERVKYWENQNNSSTEFIEERGEGGEVLRYRAGSQAHNAPTDMLELFAPMFRRMSNGKLAPTGKAPEYIPASLTVPPKPGSAAWHRAEADRLEAREAAEVARKQYAAKTVAGMIEMEKVEAGFKTKEDFDKFAHANYYSLLSEKEAEILREGETRILTESEAEVFRVLNLAWQGILMDWEDEQLKHIVKLGESLNQKNHDKAKN